MVAGTIVLAACPPPDPPDPDPQPEPKSTEYRFVVEIKPPQTEAALAEVGEAVYLTALKRRGSPLLNQALAPI